MTHIVYLGFNKERDVSYTLSSPARGYTTINCYVQYDLITKKNSFK